MKDSCLFEYANILERALSTGYKYGYSFDSIERNISYSPFFQLVEKSDHDFSPIVIDTALIKSLYLDIDVNLMDVPVYNQCLWAAESYMRIQHETRLSFETIFLIMPLKEMYSCFPLYHEMDFSQIVQLFLQKKEEKTVFAILLNKYGYKLSDIAKKTKISKETLYSLKQGKREIKKANVDIVQKLANFFNVRIETFAAIEL